MKVFIGVGHGGKDPGAVANGLEEADLNLAIALYAKAELERNNVEVKLSRYVDEDDDLNEEVRECNAYNPDVAVDVHNNAGGGDGFEALVSVRDDGGRRLAKYIEAEVIELGQNTRGLKTRKRDDGRDYYGFLRNTNCTAIILEGAFVDNRTDISIMDEPEEQMKFGIAYARGIMKYLGIEVKENVVAEKYKNIDELPEWAKPTVEKLVEEGFLAGTGNGLDLSEDMVRILAILDRALVFSSPKKLEELNKRFEETREQLIELKTEVNSLNKEIDEIKAMLRGV